MKISDHMAKWLVTSKPDDSVFDAMRTFLNNRISGAPVETVESDGDINALAERFKTSHGRRFPVLQDGRTGRPDQPL